MSRTTIDRSNRAIFGARFTEQFQIWKSKGEGRTQTSFGKLMDPPASRGSVKKWSDGDNIPTPQRIKQICKIFGVPDDYFNTNNATHEELYEHGSAFITQVGRYNVDYAKQRGLNLDVVRALSKIVDFDELFPVYAPINHATKDTETGKVAYDRNVNFYNSAPIDEELNFLQVNQNGKRITFHRCDLMFLKEVQDQVADFVEYLFYKRSKEMEKEVQSFNDDLIIEEKISDTETKITHRAVDEEYILAHDRFAQYFDRIYEEPKKATQDDINNLYNSGIIQEISQENWDKLISGESVTIKKEGK